MRKKLPVTRQSIEENLNDIAGIRVICSYIDDIYRIADALAAQDDIELLETKDYIKQPKPNGYRSLHLIVSVPVFFSDTKKTVKAEVSSHILGELEKIATHYGIIRHGQMIKEMTAQELDADCRTYIALKAGDMVKTKHLLQSRYTRVEEDESGYLRVYDIVPSQEIVRFLYDNGIVTGEIRSSKINLEEYYTDLMQKKEER